MSKEQVENQHQMKTIFRGFAIIHGFLMIPFIQFVRWYFLGIPALILFLLSTSASCIVASTEYRKKYFKADLTTERLTWIDNYGKEISREAYLNEIQYVQVTRIDDEFHTDVRTGQLINATFYELHLNASREEPLFILRSEKRSEVENIAYELSRFLQRPLKTFDTRKADSLSSGRSAIE